MKKLMMALMMLVAAGAAKADWQCYYAMLSVFSPGQIPVATSSINGVRANAIYGECQNINGLDLGVVGRVRERAAGLQVNAWSAVGTDAMGAQLGLVNTVEGEFAGFQAALWNDVAGNAAGFQLGACNTATAISGLQLGLVNYAAGLDGVQVGLLNLIGEYDGWRGCLPLVNFSFK